MNFGNLCHFDVVLVVVYEIYYKWWLLPSSSHGCVNVYIPGFNLCIILVSILYINSVSLSVCLFVEVLKPRSLLIKLSPWTRRPKNYLGPRVLTSYFYFYVCFHAAIAGGPYFLLLLLRPFPRSNCRRRWGRYFWDLEGGWRDLGALFLG